MRKRKRHSTVSPKFDRSFKRDKFDIESETDFEISSLTLNPPPDLSVILERPIMADAPLVSNTDTSEGSMQAQSLNVVLGEDDINKIASAVRALLFEDIQGLLNKIQVLEDENRLLRDRLDESEQFQKRNNIVITGLPESADETHDKLDKSVLSLVSKIEANVPAPEIDRIFRVGKPSLGKTRPIVVRLTNFAAKKRIMKSRPELKKKGMKKVFINEDLTKPRQQLAYAARQGVKRNAIKKTWTDDGKVFIIDNNDRKHRVDSLPTLEGFCTMMRSPQHAGQQVTYAAALQHRQIVQSPSLTL
ncbi:hypothetical protein FSP39_002893 [Pinctada imbricata]|uniref:Uncharacterized protein n=1 Tax=Pinctada imbricata TaxID=66713 RepID=A0AA88YVP3_PINIB|nr:hypothetical protein FSP39_002893 [Pinctada imbricata]